MEKVLRKVGIGISAGAVLFSGIVLWHYLLRGANEGRDRDNHLLKPAVNITDNEIEANELLKGFPETIPGSKSVDKYIVEDAKYCLIHVRSRHPVGSSNPLRIPIPPRIQEVQNDVFSTSSSIPSQTRRIQKDIHSILSYLIKHHGLREVYAEAIIPEKAEIINSYDSNLYPDDLERRVLVDTVICSFDKAHLALSRLVDEKKIKILAAESRETYRKASAGPPCSPHLIPGVMIKIEDREDALLNIISQQQQKVVVTVFGAAHCWGGKDSFGTTFNLYERRNLKDNIAVWNKTYPRKKFSLIEITPKSLIYPLN